MRKLKEMVGSFVRWFAGLSSQRGRRTRSVIREAERLKKMLAMVAATSEEEIACDEAYRLLDEFAEMVLRGEDAETLLPEVKHHLEMCMDCREEFEALLRALRASTARDKTAL